MSSPDPAAPVPPAPAAVPPSPPMPTGPLGLPRAGAGFYAKVVGAGVLYLLAGRLVYAERYDFAAEVIGLALYVSGATASLHTLGVKASAIQAAQAAPDLPPDPGSLPPLPPDLAAFREGLRTPDPH